MEAGTHVCHANLLWSSCLTTAQHRSAPLQDPLQQSSKKSREGGERPRAPQEQGGGMPGFLGRSFQSLPGAVATLDGPPPFPLLLIPL